MLVRSPVMPTPTSIVVGGHDEAMSEPTPARLSRIITDLGNVGTRSARATVARAMKRGPLMGSALVCSPMGRRKP